MERLPHDLVTSRPLKYRAAEGGQFALYSVGLNGQDDAAGGDDWGWRYPAK